MIYFLVYIIIIIILLLAISGILYRRGSGVCICQNKLYGKTVIITCANSGTSTETAFDLASRGAKLILACKHLDVAERIKESIITQTGNENIVVSYLDFSDLSSVRKFAEETLSRESRIDILINNSGENFHARKESSQGFERTLCTNYYGPFLLTNLLLDQLIKSAPSRIINVTSIAHKSFYLKLDDIHFKKRDYSAYASFAQAKLCNVLFTKELSRRLAGTGVTVNAVNPGIVQNEILTEQSALSSAVNVIGVLLFKAPTLGAQSIIHLAASSKLEKVSGEYFVDCKIAESSKKALDPLLAKELWEFTEEEIGLHEEEKADY